VAEFDLMGVIFKTFVGLFYLRIEPIYESVFNTRPLNIEAASVGGLVIFGVIIIGWLRPRQK
jgi:hypothetical protein